MAAAGMRMGIAPVVRGGKGIEWIEQIDRVSDGMVLGWVNAKKE